MALAHWTDVFAYHRFWSIFLGILNVVCWSYYNVLVDLTKVFNNGVILLACVCFNLFAVTPLLYFTWRKLNIKGRLQSLWCACFGLFDVFLILLMSYAFQHAPIGDAACLFALRVVWTPTVEAVLKRRCIPFTQVLTVTFALVGAVLITRPNFLFQNADHDPLKYPNLFRAYGIAFVAGILAGMQYIFLAFCPNVHWSVWQVAIVPVGVVIAPINYFTENGLTYPLNYGPLDVFAVFLIALFDVLGRACRTCAVQEHTASTVALVSTLEIPFSYFWGWVYAGEQLHRLQMIGALLVIVSILILSIPAKWGKDEQLSLVSGSTIPHAAFNTSSDVVTFPADASTKPSSSSSSHFALPLPFSTVAKLRGDPGAEDAEAIVEADELQQHNSQLQQLPQHQATVDSSQSNTRQF